MHSFYFISTVVCFSRDIMSGKQANIKDLREILDNVARNEGIENPIISFKDTSAKGDGYLGLISFFDLEGIKNGQKIILNLVVKSAPADPKSRKSIDIRDGFLIEQFFYSEIYKQFSAFESKHGVLKPFVTVPKCYAVSSLEFNEILVMENLKMQGFEMFKRDQRMNEAHLSTILKEYGKFHAISLAMKDKEPQVFNELANKINENMMTDFFVRNRKVVCDLLEKVQRHLVEIGKENVANGLNKYKERATERLLEDMRKRDQFSVIAHGDCWLNNFMFRYDDNNKSAPSAIRMLDWQAALHTTPALDLGYFFWTSAHPNDYKNHENYLKIYHRSLCNHLENFDMDGDKVLPFDELRKQWTIGCRYGFTMSLFIFKAMLVDADEVPDITAQSEGEEGTMSEFSKDFSRTPEYLDRCQLLAEFMHQQGFLL